MLRLGAEHSGKPATLLWLEPRSGRRHQLRLHTAHHGHPIVGDVTYAGDKLCYRTFLHAAALELPLGGSGAEEEDDDGILRLAAPLSPRGWAHAFEAQEELRLPDGWPGAAALTL